MTTNWLTVKQAAERTGFSESLIYCWTATEKRLRHIRIGKKGARGSIRIDPADLQAFIEDELTVGPPPKKAKASPAGAFRHIDPRESGRARLTASSS